jgi:hypothetical protein
MKIQINTRDNNILINGWRTRRTRTTRITGTGSARVQIYQPVPVP